MAGEQNNKLKFKFMDQENKKPFSKKIWILLIVIAVVCLIGFFLKGNKNEINQEETEQIRQYSDSMAENILSAINEDDYQKHSENFTEKMKNAAPEPVFRETNTLIKSKIGDYLSKDFWKAEKTGLYTVVYYKTKFSEEAEVIVKVVFEKIGDKMYVSGLWFDSPKLRGE